MKTSRQLLFPTVILPIMMGCIGLYNVTNKPRFAGFHSVDVVQLIAAGMCFGAALVSLLLVVKSRRVS